MAAGDAEVSGLPRSGVVAILATSNHLRSARQSLVCYTALPSSFVSAARASEMVDGVSPNVRRTDLER